VKISGPLLAGFFHLSTLLVKEGQRVHKGAPIGYIGHNPSKKNPAHLHFEVMQVRRPSYRPINPAPFLRTASFDVTRDGLLYPVLPLPNTGMMVDGVLLDGRAPGISSGHKDDNPDRETHDGVDIMFPRHDADTQPVKSGAGAPRWVMPAGIIAVAPGAGKIVDADDSPSGYRVWLEIENTDPGRPSPSPKRGSIGRVAAFAASGIGAIAAGVYVWDYFAERRRPKKPQKAPRRRKR